MNFKNEITIVFFSLLCLSIIIKIILDIENYFYRKKRLNFIPEDFKSYIDKEKLTEINNYSNDKLIFDLVQYIFDKA